ncbi:MAG: glycine C-acetyltransferase [Armatimonadota bacterium]
MGKYDFITEELARLKNEGLYNTIRTLESPQGAWIVVDGKKVLNMCSNNYLGFANDPRIVSAAKEALDKYGAGPGAVRSIAGTMDLHIELERKLAEFKKVEAVLFLQSGFVANQAVIPPIAASKEDGIFTDELNHASIIDGVRLTKAQRFIYKHNDADDLKRKLEEGKNCKTKLIITDGVFSMDGDIAPLDKIAEVAGQYNAITMVDDAHGEGVLGSSGRGIVDHFKLHNKFDIEIGTMSKAFGVVGGFVAGKKELIDYLRQKARPFLFSSAVTPPDTAACMAAVEVLLKSDELVEKLWDNAAYFKEGMKKLGFDTGVTQTPITPVMLGEASVAQQFSKKLFEEGIFAMAIGYPTVPKGKARIRVMISAAHSKEDLDITLKAFEKVGKELKAGIS